MTGEGAHARALEAHTRRLLHEHAATVVPGDGLPAIRARIARRPWWRRWLSALARHTHDLQGDPLFPDDVRCRICGERPCKNAAPVSAGAAPNPTAVKEPTMTTIIQRHARDLHAGDVIVHDPDHDRPVRWRVSRPPVRTRDGEYALTDVTDLATGESHVTYYPALQSLAVEPVGGAS